jgi:hypothetical protein
MNSPRNVTLKSLSALGVAYCLQRLSRASAGTWQVLDAKVSYGTFEDALKQHDFNRPAAAVYVGLKGRSPLTAMMLFDPADMECVSRCYTGQAFHREGRLTPADEMMLVELGNMVINALLSSLLNPLKKGFMPAVPRFIEGDLARLAGELLQAAGIKTSFRIITVMLEMRSGDCAAKSEVFALITEEMALELENLRPSPWLPPKRP